MPRSPRKDRLLTMLTFAGPLGRVKEWPLPSHRIAVYVRAWLLSRRTVLDDNPSMQCNRLIMSMPHLYLADTGNPHP